MYKFILETYMMSGASNRVQGAGYRKEVFFSRSPKAATHGWGARGATTVHGIETNEILGRETLMLGSRVIYSKWT